MRIFSFCFYDYSKKHILWHFNRIILLMILMECNNIGIYIILFIFTKYSGSPHILKFGRPACIHNLVIFLHAESIAQTAGALFILLPTSCFRSIAVFHRSYMLVNSTLI